jgi:hypothetical protein
MLDGSNQQIHEGVMNLVLFAGASNQKKIVSIYHGDHLKYAPPVNGRWSDLAALWLRHAPFGVWIIEGDKISNLKEQWILVEIKKVP